MKNANEKLVPIKNYPANAENNSPNTDFDDIPSIGYYNAFNCLNEIKNKKGEILLSYTMRENELDRLYSTDVNDLPEEDNVINFVKIDNHIYAIYYYNKKAYYAVKTDYKNERDLENIKTRESEENEKRTGKNLLACDIKIPIDSKNIENFTPTKNDVCIGDIGIDNKEHKIKNRDCLIKTDIDNKNLKNIHIFLHGNNQYASFNPHSHFNIHSKTLNSSIYNYFLDKYGKKNVKEGHHDIQQQKPYLRIQTTNGIEDYDTRNINQIIPPHFNLIENKDNDNLLQVIDSDKPFPAEKYEYIEQVVDAIKNNRTEPQKYLLVNDYSCYGAVTTGKLSMQSAISAIDFDKTIIINTARRFNPKCIRNDTSCEDKNKTQNGANIFIKGEQKFFNSITPYLSHIVFDKRLALNKEQLKTFDCYCMITHEDYIELQNAMSKDDKTKIDNIIEKYKKIKQYGRELFDTSLLSQDAIKLLEKPLSVNMIRNYLNENNKQYEDDNERYKEQECIAIFKEVSALLDQPLYKNVIEDYLKNNDEKTISAQKIIDICKKFREKLPYVEREAMNDKNGECITDLGKTKYDKKTGKFSFKRNKTKKDLEYYNNLTKMTNLQKEYIDTKNKKKKQQINKKFAELSKQTLNNFGTMKM